VPETGAGRVLRFRHQLLPRTAADCFPYGVLTPRPSLEVFIQDSGLPFPAGIARDPASCGWAVCNLIGGTAAVAWFKNYGARDPAKGPLPPGTYNPYGVAVARNGDLYFVDIHLESGPGGIGPGDQAGCVFKVTFAHGTPSLLQPIATGLNFPTSVTICTGRDCPTPP
jgi:hypothetical protein